MRYAKDELGHALIRFRNELGQLGIPSTKRTQYMEQFKRRYASSLDYELAMSMVLEDFFGKSAKKDRFKTYWRITNHPQTEKGILSWINNQRNLVEVERIRDFVRNSLKSGQSTTSLFNYLTALSIQQLGRPLTSQEEDKIEMVMLEEKVKLQDRGYQIS